MNRRKQGRKVRYTRRMEIQGKKEEKQRTRKSEGSKGKGKERNI